MLCPQTRFEEASEKNINPGKCGAFSFVLARIPAPHPCVSLAQAWTLTYRESRFSAAESYSQISTTTGCFSQTDRGQRLVSSLSASRPIQHLNRRDQQLRQPCEWSRP